MFKAKDDFQIEVKDGKRESGGSPVFFKKGDDVFGVLTAAEVVGDNAKDVVLTLFERNPLFLELSYVNTKPVLSDAQTKLLDLSPDKKESVLDKLDKMNSKSFLDKWAAKFGVALDRRKSLSDMKDQFKREYKE